MFVPYVKAIIKSCHIKCLSIYLCMAFTQPVQSEGLEGERYMWSMCNLSTILIGSLKLNKEILKTQPNEFDTVTISITHIIAVRWHELIFYYHQKAAYNSSFCSTVFEKVTLFIRGKTSIDTDFGEVSSFFQ